MPRSLSARLTLTLVGLALVILVGVGAGLFVVLRELHSEAQQSGVVDLVETLLPQARTQAAGGDLRGALADVESSLSAKGVTAYLLTADGRLRTSDGAVAGLAPADVADPTGPRGTTSHGVATFPDGQRYAWAESALRAGAAVGPRALVFAQPDASGREALGDLAVALPVIVVVTVLLGGLLGWLLTRSITGPIARLAHATARLTGRTDWQPLPLEGPAEVRELTARFNTMAAALAESRRRETELLANLRHDLRTPVTVISGFASALVDGVATGDQARNAARAIGEEADRLGRLVDELGSLERLEAGRDGLRPEPLDAGAVLASAAERFAERARTAGVEIGLVGRQGAEPLRLTADRNALDRMIGNLVTNAIAAFGGAPGHVWLEARATRLGAPGDGAPDARAAGDAPAGPPDAVALIVSDDGPGFPPGAAARVFDRFYRADPARTGPGSGLGLAIVRELARAHGGDAIAEQLAPHGARMSVILPVVARPLAADGGDGLAGR